VIFIDISSSIISLYIYKSTYFVKRILGKERKRGDLALIKYKDETPRFVIFLGYYFDVYKKSFFYWGGEGAKGPPVFLEQLPSGEWVEMSRQYNKSHLKIEWLS